MDTGISWTSYVICVTIILYLGQLFILQRNIDHERNVEDILPLPRKRKKDFELEFHLKRRRVQWSSWVRELGDVEFKRHHRVSMNVFNDIYGKIHQDLEKQAKYARNTCCHNGKSSHVDGRARLGMLCKHLSGSRTQDIERTFGVSRSTVVQTISSDITYNFCFEYFAFFRILLCELG